MEASLKVLNFAIYHKELTDMEEREQERERELGRNRKADHGNNGRVPGADIATSRYVQHLLGCFKWTI